MNETVNVTVTGIQGGSGMDSVPVSMQTQARYYERNGSTYLLYDEVLDGFKDPFHTMIKFKDGSLEMTRKGVIEMRMLYEEGKQFATSYATPYGNLLMEINTRTVRVERAEKRIKVSVFYSMDMGDMPMEDCSLHIVIGEPA